jgi:hypothetical protein
MEEKSCPILNSDKKGNRKCASTVLVAHACNPSYSGGRNQEDCGLKPAQANSSQDPVSKKPITKKGWQSDSQGRLPA